MILKAGPCFIGGKFFVLQQWTFGVRSQREKIARVPIWVNIFNLPKVLYSKQSLGFGASLVRKPYRMDDIIAKRTILEFARVCVIIDVNQSLLKRIPINVRGRRLTSMYYINISAILLLLPRFWS